MHPISGQSVMQVPQKNSSNAQAVIHQNGQQVILGKFAPNSNSSRANANANTELQIAQDTSSSNYPAHYIEAIAEHTIYTGNGDNGSIHYQGYAPIIYAPVSTGQNYYQTAGGQLLSNTAFPSSAGQGQCLPAGHAQLVTTHQGPAYLVQNSQLEEDTSSGVSHAARASPVTVQWLIENYETAEGVSLPRSTLYFHYLQHCNEHKLEPMNPASFGKLIRSVFYGLRTRRLGTRGNSKYHYYGIRIKPTSPLNNYVEDAGFSIRHYPNYTSRLGHSSDASHSSSVLITPANADVWRPSSSSLMTTSSSAAIQHQSTASIMSRLKTVEPILPTSHNSVVSQPSNSDGLHQSLLLDTARQSRPATSVAGSSSSLTHTQFLGEASSALPNLDEICRSAGLPVPGEVDTKSSNDVTPPIKSTTATNTNKATVSDDKSKSPSSTSDSATDSAPSPKQPEWDPELASEFVTFCRLYARSAGEMLDAVVNLDFTSIETVWKQFWTRARTETAAVPILQDKQFNQEDINRIVAEPGVLQFLRLYDHTFYQSLAEVLIPNVLRPIPPPMTRAIRNFAKSLEGWMRQATSGMSDALIRLKLSAVSALAQTLRRYTSLNHLAQAARGVLKNTNQINQMLADLNRVDFTTVQEQASWVCHCNDHTVNQLVQEFKHILHRHASLEEWAQWLDTVVSSILQPAEGNNAAFTEAAHLLTLKWSFYSSVIIRDLTLRSAASFGSFHLIRLLFDEYIFYLVEHKVAAHLGMTPVAVMGEMGRYVARHQPSLHDQSPIALSDHQRSTALHRMLMPKQPISSTLAGDGPDQSDNEEVDDQRRHVANACGEDDDEEGDEEIDEYLDDDEDVDDLTGEEGALLRHAHASAQAYCRSAGNHGSPAIAAPINDPTAVTGEVDQPPVSSSSNGLSVKIDASSAPVTTNAVSPTVNTTDDPVQSSAVPVTTTTVVPLADDLDSSQAGSPPLLVATSAYPAGSSSSTNSRKVVRVTSFRDALIAESFHQNRLLSGDPHSPSIPAPSIASPTSLPDSLSSATPCPTTISSSTDLQPPVVKRVKLA